MSFQNLISRRLVIEKKLVTAEAIVAAKWHRDASKTN
jgi:hypothetical protein